MDSPERSRSYGKKEADDSLEGKRDGAADEEEWEGGKRKHKFSKSRRSSNGEDNDGWDGSGRRKSSGDRNESRRQSVGTSRVDIDEGDCDAKKDSSSKPVKKKQESSSLENLSSWYQDGDSENKHDGGDKSGNRSHSRSDDNERNALRKVTPKFSDHESSHRRTKNKDERPRGGENEKALDRDTYHSDRKEIGREKGYGFSEEVKSTRKWDETEVPVKAGDASFAGKSEPRSGSGYDFKHETVREKSASSKNDAGEGKDRALESSGDKSRSYSKEERRVDSDRSKNRGRSDAVEEDGKAVVREDRSGREKNDRHREMRISGREAVDYRDKPSNPDDDGSPWPRDVTAREVPYSQRSRSPDRSGRHHHDLENSEMEYERGGSLKRKDIEKDVFRDDRLKGRENNWSDRNRDREGSRESWKRRQQVGNDRDVDLVHDRDRERELPRRGRDRMMDNERGLGRGGNRKDGRSEAVKASSNFGISTENYDVIEIQPKPLDYGRDDSSFGRKTEAVPLHDPKSTSHNEWGRLQDDLHSTDGYVTAGDGASVKNVDDSVSVPDQNAWRDDVDGRPGRLRGQQSSLSGRPSGGQSSSSGSQPFNVNQDANNFGIVNQQGHKGNRLGRGGRFRPPGRDNQQVNVPVPLMGSPFGHLGMPPPGPMQPMNPGLSPGPVPPVPPGVFGSPFSPPVWPGSRGIDISMLPISPGVSPIPPGPPGQRFPHMGTPPHPALFFNQPGLGRGVPMNASGPGFNPILPIGRGNPNDKTSGDWIPPKSGGPPGKAPSRGEQNDYSQNFVDTGSRPQNFIRELELTNVEDYPKLRELIQKKDEIVDKAATPPMYYKCDLKEFALSPEVFGTKFDVILVDPPWEEYVHRAPGVTDHMDYWTFEEIKNLKIEAIADTPSFIFLWVGDSVGLEQGRQCLKKWGFRRCEDICWVKTNKTTANPGLRHDSNTLFQHTKEHCLMGIKGTVRRSTDGHIIHANIDTDVIIAEEPAYGSTAKPDEMYRIIEHFALGRRRIELFGEDHNIRKGWLTVGKGLSSSNFNAEAYVRSFADKDGKVWQGGGGRNPPPEAPHLVQTTPDIEALRPKSPMKNQQQMQQQQSNSISLTSANSSSRRGIGNSPQNPPGFSMNAEASGSNHPAPWAPPMEGFKGPNENLFDMYGYNMHPMQPSGEFLDYDTQRMMGMM